jgi:hypothetical protein
MTVFDLMERLGGEILMNRIRAIIDGRIVIIATLNDQEWEYTEAGQALYNQHSNLVAEEEAANKTTKTRKKEAVVVESVAPQDEIVVEVADEPAPTPEQ